MDRPVQPNISADLEDAPSQPEQRSVGLIGWLRRAAVVGLIVSIAVHVVGLITAGLIVFQDRDGALGPGGVPDPVEFAVMTEAELAEAHGEAFLESAEARLVTAELELVEPTMDQLISPEAVMPEVELPELTSDLAALEPLGSDAGDAGSDSLGGGLAGSGGGTSFFGVEARGSRFAFVVDWSGSMATGGKAEAAERELRGAVEGLTGEGAFFVVLYASEAVSLGDRGDWTDANDRGKRWADRVFSGLPVPRGGTDPVPGFELLTKLRPRPDAVYFMTDGEFQAEMVPSLLGLQRTFKAPVHCITFVNRRAEPMMRQIADATGGTYTHVGGRP
ncbi:MAG: hypothetical protein AAGB51_04315 [Planctomycetota bacterium]